MTAGKLLLTIPETAQVLGVGVASVNRYIREGTIPSVKLGGRRLVPRKKLEDRIDALVR